MECLYWYMPPRPPSALLRQKKNVHAPQQKNRANFGWQSHQALLFFGLASLNCCGWACMDYGFYLVSRNEVVALSKSTKSKFRCLWERQEVFTKKVKLLSDSRKRVTSITGTKGSDLGRILFNMTLELNLFTSNSTGSLIQQHKSLLTHFRAAIQHTEAIHHVCKPSAKHSCTELRGETAESAQQDIRISATISPRNHAPSSDGELSFWIRWAFKKDKGCSGWGGDSMLSNTHF